MQQSEQFEHLMTPAMEQATTLIEYLLFLFKVVVIGVIFLLFLKRKKRDLKKLQIKELYNVPVQKVIIAIEIKDFLVQFQSRLKPGFELLQSTNLEVNLVWRTLENILGFKNCFKTLFSMREINGFVRGLKNCENTELMIYTSLTPEVTDTILKKLRLSQFFPPQNRKFCDPKHDDMMKHAIDVDKYSSRVLIVTPSKKDHNWQDQKYFLVLNPKGGRNKNFLRDSLRIIKSLVDQNQSLDTFHDQLAQLKIDVQQSDMSDMSDIQKQLN